MRPRCFQQPKIIDEVLPESDFNPCAPKTASSPLDVAFGIPYTRGSAFQTHNASFL